MDPEWKSQVAGSQYEEPIDTTAVWIVFLAFLWGVLVVVAPVLLLLIFRERLTIKCGSNPFLEAYTERSKWDYRDRL